MVINFESAVPGNFTNAVTFTSNGGNSTNEITGRVIELPSIKTSAINGADFTFSFLTIMGFTYQVQYADSLSEPVWQTLELVAGDGTVATVTVQTTGATQ